MLTKDTISITEPESGIAVVTLSRPAALNALNSQMATELQEFFTNTPPNIRTIILTGAGEKAFCAGADLKERAGMSVTEWEAQHRLFRQTLTAIMHCPVPVIAAVGGIAYGGGFELALACDFIYASENASFALPEATLGIMPGTGGTQTLPRAVGTRRAKEILFTGKKFSAQEALDFGLINKICPPESLISESINCAQKIAACAPLSIASIKKSVNIGINQSLNEGLITESEYYKKLLTGEDGKEGLSAFREKRKANFTGK